MFVAAGVEAPPLSLPLTYYPLLSPPNDPFPPERFGRNPYNLNNPQARSRYVLDIAIKANKANCEKFTSDDPNVVAKGWPMIMTEALNDMDVGCEDWLRVYVRFLANRARNWWDNVRLWYGR